MQDCICETSSELWLWLEKSISASGRQVCLSPLSPLLPPFWESWMRETVESIKRPSPLGGWKNEGLDQHSKCSHWDLKSEAFLQSPSCWSWECLCLPLNNSIICLWPLTEMKWVALSQHCLKIEFPFSEPKECKLQVPRFICKTKTVCFLRQALH